MIKYYSITNGRSIRHEVSKDTLDRTYHKLNPFERELLKKFSFRTENEGDEASLDLIQLVSYNGDLTTSRKLEVIGAILAGEFTVDYRRYYVHVLPGTSEGYLNASEDAPNGFYFDTKNQWGGSQTEFTKEEIEELKKRPELKGINFDECLEEVSEDED